MLKDLRHYNNLGTPSYFFELLNILNSNDKSVWRVDDLNKLFYNRVINGRNVYDGCLELAIRIDFLLLNKGIITVVPEINSSLNSENQMSTKFVECLFKALRNDESFHNIFCSEHLSYDIIYKSLQISNSAFGFKFSNFKQLLIDFGAIKIHPTPEINSFIINSRYKKLFDKTILPEIKKRKIGVEEFKKSMEQQQIFGEEAEKFVLSFENDRLNQKKTIDWVAEYIVNEGYDIASFNNEEDNDYNRFIEVKSYTGNRPYFFWSRNESLVAKRKLEKYWIYLVNRKEMNNDGYEPIMEQNPFENIINNDVWDKQIEKYRIELKDIIN